MADKPRGAVAPVSAYCLGKARVFVQDLVGGSGSLSTGFLRQGLVFEDVFESVVA